MSEFKAKVAKMKELLERASCGVINQLVIADKGEVSVLDDTKNIFVYCKDSSLDFGSDIGIYDLKLFLSYLNASLGYDDVEDVKIRDNRIVLTCKGDEYQYLLADARLISQRVKEPDKIFNKIHAIPKVAVLDLKAKLSLLTGALGLVITDTVTFKITNGKLLLEVGSSIEHKASITLAEGLSNSMEWVVSSVLLGRILASASTSETIELELRKDCPLVFKFSDVTISLNTITPKVVK